MAEPPIPTRIRRAAWLASLGRKSAEAEDPAQEIAGPGAVDKLQRIRSKKRRRTAGLLIRFTPEERAQVEEITRRAGLSMAAYARLQILGGKPPRGRRLVEQEKLTRVLGHLRSVSHSLGELTHAAHVGPAERDELDHAIRAMSELADAISESLSRRR